MKVGILTIHHALNYGAVWQAYSLAKVVRGLGAEVEIIDYRPPVATAHYREPWFKGMRPNVTGVLRQHHFKRFQETRLPLARTRCFNTQDLATQSRQYQLVLAGSDQIWCTGAGSFRGYDSNFFLDFCDKVNVSKVSYAASAGNTPDFAEHAGAIARALQQFKLIAVRDRSTAELVKRTSGMTPTLVLDPVFLHQFEEFEAAPTGDMVVFARNPKRLQPIAQSILKKHKLRVVSIGKPCSFAHVNLSAVSPVDWLKKMKGARVVLTDYFHGTAVPLRFGCPVIVNAPADKVIKITDMLEQLDLKHLFHDGSEQSGAKIDQAIADPATFKSNVFARLKVHEERSHQFLRTALESAFSAV